MNAASLGSSRHASHQLRFTARSPGQQAYAFPCDERGQVDLDALSDRVRNEYYFARKLAGHGLATRTVLVGGQLH